jgi:hypothetical protein
MDPCPSAPSRRLDVGAELPKGGCAPGCQADVRAGWAQHRSRPAGAVAAQDAAQIAPLRICYPRRTTDIIVLFTDSVILPILQTIDRVLQLPHLRQQLCPISAPRCPAKTQRSPLVCSQDGNGQRATPGVFLPAQSRGHLAIAYLYPIRVCFSRRAGVGPAHIFGLPIRPRFFWFLSSQIVAYSQGPGSANVAARFRRIRGLSPKIRRRLNS